MFATPTPAQCVAAWNRRPPVVQPGAAMVTTARVYVIRWRNGKKLPSPAPQDVCSVTATVLGKTVVFTWPLGGSRTHHPAPNTLRYPNATIRADGTLRLH